jgi:cytochrome c553
MRPRTLFVSGALAVLPSLLVFAMPAGSQEYLEAIKATPDPERGAHYFVVCSNCHGVRGGGSVDGKVPRIGGQHFRVVVRQLVAFLHGQRWDLLMENFADRHRLPDAQAVADVAAYVNGLDDPNPPGVGSGERVAEGARIYFRQCESCHGSTGQGKPEEVVPRLAGQHYEYLRRQIYDAVDGRRPGFPPSHVRLLAQLDHDAIEGVADYLSHMTPRYAEPLVIPAAQR